MSRLFSRVTLNATLAAAICAPGRVQPRAAASATRDERHRRRDTGRARCGSAQPNRAPRCRRRRCPLGLPKIDSAAVLDTIKAMSSDKFQGRAPGPVGEQITVGYLRCGSRNWGCSPVIPTARTSRRCRSSASPAAETRPLTSRGQPEAAVQVPRRLRRVDQARDRRRVDSTTPSVIFAGYGVQAPEFKWDDFKGVDVKGKTSSCWSTIRRCPTRRIRPSSIRRCSAARR